MASIKDILNFFQTTPIQTKEAPQVVLSVNSNYHYRADNYDAYADEGYSCLLYTSPSPRDNL